MLEIMRVLAGHESSWSWTAGRDTAHNHSKHQETVEAGAWQVSSNSMGWGHDLKELVQARVGSHGAKAFQDAIKSDHVMAMEYIARLLRHTVKANGPLLRRAEVAEDLSREAMAEFQRQVGG